MVVCDELLILRFFLLNRKANRLREDEAEAKHCFLSTCYGKAIITAVALYVEILYMASAFEGPKKVISNSIVIMYLVLAL
jgi:hypothetical protein